jgi:hypothetical protein
LSIVEDPDALMKCYQMPVVFVAETSQKLAALKKTLPERYCKVEAKVRGARKEAASLEYGKPL